MTSSEQARADAMADAETLRLYLLTHGDKGQRWQAREWGAGICVVGLVNSEDPREDGIAHARNAFRAVPGLRG